MDASPDNICPRCHNPLPPSAGGAPPICRVCLLDAALEAIDETEGTRSPFAQPAPDSQGNFGHFVLEEEIGRGGMSVVYRAREYESHRVVALKMLQLFLLRTPEMLRRFEVEVRAIATLDHPNIMPMYEVGQSEGIPYFSMKLAERGSLAKHMEAYRGSPRDAATLVLKIARAVFYAHQRGVIHRDLKPGNILLDANGEPYVSDFGIAKIMDADSDAARHTTAIGTPNYLAPELVGGAAGGITVAADIYGLGAILYELLAGRPPAIGKTPIDVIDNLAKGPPPPPRSLNPSIPRDLGTLCMKCLAHNPADRYASAAELADDLANFLDGRPVTASPPSLAGQFWLFCRRQPVVTSLTAGIILLLAAIAVGGVRSAFSIAAQRDRALRAEGVAQEQLYNSLLMQVRLGRQTGLAGHRFDGLNVLRQAAAIRTGDDLRNEAAALLTLTDMRVERTFTARTSPNHPVVFDPALDRYLVCIDKDNGMSLRNFADGSEIAAYPGTRRNVLSLSPFSADGRFVASRHYDGFIRVWDTRGHRMVFELTKRLPKNRPYQSVRFWFGCAFSRDGKLAAVELAGGGYSVHDVSDSGRELARFPDKPSAYALAFDDTGKRLAYADRGAGVVEIRDPLTGEKLRSLEHPAEVFCFEWSPDGAYLAVGCNDALIYIWNTATGRRHRILDGHRNRVTHLAFSPDGRVLASTSQERNIILWDPESGNRHVSYPDCGHEPVLRFSGDGGRLVSTNFQLDATVFEVVTDDKICRTFSPQGRSHNAVFTASVDFSPDERWLVSSTRRVINLWDIGRHRLAAELRPGGDAEIAALFSPDGSALYVASRLTGLSRHPFDPANPDAPLGDPVPLMKEAGYTLSDFCAGAPYVLLTNRSADPAMQENALLWPLDPADAPRRYKVQREALAAALSTDGKILATTSAGQSSRPGSKKLHLWDFASGEKLAELDGGDGGLVRFTPDGSRIIATSRYHFAIWDAATRERVNAGPELDMSFGLCVSPDNRYLCVAGDGNVILYQGNNYDDPVLQLSPAGNRNAGSRMTFSRGGNLLAIHESDGVVRLWNIRELRAALATLGLDWRDPAR